MNEKQKKLCVENIEKLANSIVQIMNKIVDKIERIEVDEVEISTSVLLQKMKMEGDVRDA